MIVLVEGFERDAAALAAILAAEGNEVRLAGPGDAPADEVRLRALGIRVEPHTDLDADPGAADVAYLDVWTPETAPRVKRLAAQGTRLSCLADLLLQRWPGRTIGITGTAGKTTTTALVAQILRCAGVGLAVGRGARAGNLWPTGDLLEDLAAAADSPPTLLLELTSSHLAFMHHSPQLAAVISFWPDHLELHGSLDRYRAAKATIVRHQSPADTLVVNDDDAACFAEECEAHVVRFSLRDRVGRSTVHARNVVAAAAIARAAGAGVSAIEEGIVTAELPPWRAQAAGTVADARVIDDGMAATPTKAAATLAALPERSVILIAGGIERAGGDMVHAAPEEIELLERACDEVARKARLVVVFGPSAARLAPLLHARGVASTRVDDLPQAVAAAAGEACDSSAEVIVFSPMFPVSLDDRARFAELIRRHE